MLKSNTIIRLSSSSEGGSTLTKVGRNFSLASFVIMTIPRDTPDETPTAVAAVGPSVGTEYLSRAPRTSSAPEYPLVFGGIIVYSG